MKRTFFLLCFSVCLAACASAAEPVGASDQLLMVAIKEIQAQQAQLAENQAKIDAKLVSVTEAVRVSRIFSSRAGH